MNRTILHIDFNSYFATVEQQANPRLRGKPIGVTGGDRLTRTVLGAASIEAKRYGVKTGMQIWQARQLCPNLILVPGDSDKYLECTKRFLNILKDYSPYLEVFSIDECFLELVIPTEVEGSNSNQSMGRVVTDSSTPLRFARNDKWNFALDVALEIKKRMRTEIGDFITCSIGISYNKLMAKLAGSLYKPDGLVVIEDPEAAQFILDRVKLDDICGIGPRIKKRLYNIGVTDFKKLRAVPKELLLASFKSYGEVLYNMARGIDMRPINPFYEKEEVKSVGHRHTNFYDLEDPREIQQVMLKICEMVGKRLRDKKLVGKTISLWFRYSFIWPYLAMDGDGGQCTVSYTNDGMEICKASWQLFLKLWDKRKVRMVGVSVSNLKPINPHTISFLDEDNLREKLNRTMDKVNNKFGDFVIERGSLLKSPQVTRKPNPFLTDRRFRI